MKFNKLFFAAVAFAALAMVSCKKTPEPQPQPEPEPDVPEMPSIAAPAAGQTTIAIYAEVCPKGAYLVGSNQGYNINDDALSFAAVEGAENWYAITIDYAADLQVKAIARPSDETVPFGWSYQWGPNFDPDAAQPLVEDEEHNNTLIIGGTGEFVFENQGEVKLANVADAGVVYVWVKNWKASPVIEAKKLETCWAKTNWDQASDWTWKEMTAKGDGVFEVEGIWGGNGFNIAETEGGADAWYPTDHANVTIGEDCAAGDKVKVTFTSEKMTVGTLKVELVEKGEAPVYEYVSGKIFLKNFGTLTNLHIYGWTPDYNDNNEIFGAWPGTEVGGDATDLTQIFYEKAIKDAAYKFIINNGNGGEGNQTADTEWTVTITGENTISLMINDENQLVLDN